MLKHSSRIRTIFIGFWATALAGVVLIYFGFTSISKQRLALEQVVAKTYQESYIDELAKRQMIIYISIISGAVLAMAAGMFFTFRGVGRELEVARMKSDFVSNVSHELKTPLALIRMYGETLEMGRVPDEAMKREYLKVITKESERLTHMIDNVLDFSSIDAGKWEGQEGGEQVRVEDDRSRRRPSCSVAERR